MLRRQKEIRQEFENWLKHVKNVPEHFEYLKAMEKDKKAITDAFYKDLEFGTGGLRGIMGIGTNRVNVYTISRISRGVAAYIQKHFAGDKQSVAISYDSRINSKLFAERTAEILCSEGIKVFIYRDLMPTPMLSWAVRQLNCSAGIMITASHNAMEYNGYKVYGSDGCQITNDDAKEILEEIHSFDFFCESKVTFENGIKLTDIVFIETDVIDSFFEAVKQQSLSKAEENETYQRLSIVYTPLNGTGNYPIRHILKECGFQKVFVVPEQELPDGKFPTCPVPNPEEEKALELGVQYAKRCSADILIATDPDCDRVGVAAPKLDGSYRTLSGNEIGVLLLNYICKKRLENGIMPSKPVFMKSVVTTELAERIAEHYGIKTINLLTGFKYIGKQIGRLEQDGHKGDFLFGFEESHGYLSGDYVRDKDGVGAALLICEMAAYYKGKRKTLLEVLDEIYEEYGYCLNALRAYQFEGEEGAKRMHEIMENIRKACKSFSEANKKNGNDYVKWLEECGVSYIEDYYAQRRFEMNRWSRMNIEVPITNMVKLGLQKGGSIILRPSGTEPKMKVYLSIWACSYNEAIKLKREKIALIDKICTY